MIIPAYQSDMNKLARHITMQTNLTNCNANESGEISQ